MTGVPIAGFGLLWGLLAAALPVLALARRVDGRDDEELLSGMRIVAATGLLGAVLLVLVSALEGVGCRSCVVSQALALGYGVLVSYRFRQAPFPGGWRPAVALVAAAAGLYLMLLIPDTPASAHAIARAKEALESSVQEARTPDEGKGGGSDVGSAEELDLFLSSLGPDMRQALADAISLFEGAPAHPIPPLRNALGADDAPVRLTVFSDARCTHCATLHEALGDLMAVLPETSFTLDSRHFPLDGRCNPKLGPRDEDLSRCLAARAEICVESTGRSFELSGEILSRQDELEEDLVLELATKYLSRAELEVCLDSPETLAALEEDLELAWRYEPRGTPLVLINGREAVPYPPFLYAMVLAGGDPRHPSFEKLPEPER
jgi:serine/threonine-protein kinase